MGHKAEGGARGQATQGLVDLAAVLSCIQEQRKATGALMLGSARVSLPFIKQMLPCEVLAGSREGAGRLRSYCSTSRRGSARAGERRVWMQREASGGRGAGEGEWSGRSGGVKKGPSS